jgi:hypothetical protein
MGVWTALQEIDPKLRIVRGYRHLRELREAMKDLNFKENIIKVASCIVQFQLTMGLCLRKFFWTLIYIFEVTLQALFWIKKMNLKLSTMIMVSKRAKNIIRMG